MGWKNHRLRLLRSKMLPLFSSCIFIFFFFSAFALLISTKTTTPCQDIRSQMTSITKADIYYIQKFENSMSKGKSEVSLLVPRRLLSGPGSWPPRCTSKCGRCTPCRPVHVAVPPGTPVTAEYYPEAWRCKCGNKLYMP